MKHMKTVSKSMPAQASFLTWLPSLKAAMGGVGGYVNSLFGQFDGRTADPADGDIGNPAVM